MSKEKHLISRQQLGNFFYKRRNEMGKSAKELADFVGISFNTMTRIEAGSFDYDIMLMFRICEALEIKPYFVPHELQKQFTDNIFGTNLN